MSDDARRLQLVIGGSHRQYSRHMQALEGFRDSLPLRAGIGSKRFTVIVRDTAELRRTIATTKGISIARRQPAWLNE